MADANLSKSSLLSTAEAYHVLSKNYNAHPSLLQDSTCLHFLVFLLGESDENILLLALKSLVNLAQVKSNRGQIKSTYFLLKALEDTLASGHRSSPQIVQLASRLLQTLTDHREPLRDATNISSPLHATGKSRLSTAVGVGLLAHTLAGRKRVETKFMRNNRQGRNVVLHIIPSGTTAAGMGEARLPSWDECKKHCESVLAKVKGVISITFISNKQRCLVRIRPEVSVKDLVHAVNSTGIIQAEQVTKDQTGNEILVSHQLEKDDDNKKTLSSSSHHLPSYLSDDSSLTSPTTNKDYAVRRKGSREEETSGWLNSTVNYLQNMFYW